MELSSYFDQITVINLKRRPDRLDYFWKTIKDSNWPFVTPVVFEAIDAQKIEVPAEWKSVRGAYGCSLSHQTVLQEFIQSGKPHLLVLEDDIAPVDNFPAKTEKFLKNVPDDWDGLMFGGHHVKPAKVICEGVAQCQETLLMHAYAVTSHFAPILLSRLVSNGEDGGFSGNDQCDVIFSQESGLQQGGHVYAPQPWLINQAKPQMRLDSDIRPRRKPNRQFRDLGDWSKRHLEDDIDRKN